MRISKILGLLLLAGIVWAGGIELEKWFSTSQKAQIVSIAEAIVGRPLTPVSVAGVARRTARRTVMWR
ncbi:MAG: hypothetical protein P8Y40_00520 [Desulfobacterales bacterium]|jgi:hypothetical protein